MENKGGFFTLITKNDIALVIALMFHVSGCIGMFTSYRQWFINSTPLNLAIVFALVLFTQKNKNKGFYQFLFICFITGMLTEMIGVNSGLLFGHYQYGAKLGPKLYQVPFLIGTNWFVIMYCSGIATHILHQKIEAKYIEHGRLIPEQVLLFSFIIDAALLATFFDWVMEPVAIKFTFWSWAGNGSIPLYNYLCWFVISGLLTVAFRLLTFDKENHFAVHLLLIQLLFFGVLRTFL